MVVTSNGTTDYRIYTDAAGTGTLRPLNIYTGTNTNQLYLDTDGNIGMNTNNPTSPTGFATFLHIKGTAAALVLEDSDGGDVFEIANSGGTFFHTSMTLSGGISMKASRVSSDGVATYTSLTSSGYISTQTTFASVLAVDSVGETSTGPTVGLTSLYLALTGPVGLASLIGLT